MKIKIFLMILICAHAFNCFAQTETTKNKFNFIIKGKGNPVVVFESGLGETLEGCRQIQDSISKVATTVSYDRLGLGKSSATEKPRTLDNLANELNSFLENNNIEGPYIMVGHSLGGFIIRNFQDIYPEKVIGLIMVDPSHELLFETIFASKPKEQADGMRNGLKDFYASKPLGIQNEFNALSDNEEKMKAIKFPSNIPITLLASYQTPPSPFAPEDIEIKQKLFNNWIKEAPQTKLVSTVKSGHYIHYSEPAIVIDEIKEMIKKVKK
jgi:pimeloyl-ACP methyl ester carboxylesterase